MRDVDINILSTVTTEGNKDTIELFTGGQYNNTRDGFILKYREGDGIGYDNCDITITYVNDVITIERTGIASSTFTLEKDIKHHCMYTSPYGEFTLGINTYDIQNALTEMGGRLYFKYSIDINSDFISENEMEITVK